MPFLPQQLHGIMQACRITLEVYISSQHRSEWDNAIHFWMFYMRCTIYMEINSHSYIWNAEVNGNLTVTVHHLSAKHSLRRKHIKHAEQKVQFLFAGFHHFLQIMGWIYWRVMLHLHIVFQCKNLPFSPTTRNPV